MKERLLFLLLLLAALPGVVASGQENSSSQMPTMKFQLPPITNLQEILATNEQNLWTRTVNLSDVKVQRFLNDKHFLLIGRDGGQTVLVQLGGLHPEIKEGQKVNISGMIDPLGKDLSQWNVSPADRQVLARHTMFIRPASITPANH